MMYRRWFAWLGFAAIAMAVLLIAADPASAQRFGRSGFYYAPGQGFGYGNPYYGGYGPNYSGYGPNYGGYSPQYGYGWGNYPTYSRGWAYNNWYNNPEYSGAWWNAPGYGQPASGYYGERTQGDYYSSTTGPTPSSGTMAQGGSTMDGQVLINVRVPPNAEVWFDDQKTSQTGPMRSFITPSLDPDHDYVYHIRARWTEDGRQVDKTRRVDVHAGDRHFVNFMGPRQGGMRGPSGQYGATPSDGAENRDQNRQQNPDRTLEDNRPQPGNATPGAPQNKTNQPPVKQP